MLKTSNIGWQKTDYSLPDEGGHFGTYGGRFVAETLMAPLSDLERAYDELIDDQRFLETLRNDGALP